MIRQDELDFFQGEKNIKSEYVFLEKSDKPSSRTGVGINQGILILTNRRLFFFNIKEGKSTAVKRGRKMATHIVSEIANHFTLGLASFAISMVEAGIETGVEHLRHKENIDLVSISKNEKSFVISIHDVVDCRKYGGAFTIGSKGRYVQISIRQYIGVEKYCIYGLNPKDQETFIKYDQWYKEIENLRKA
jgi:hypothetical protein